MKLNAGAVIGLAVLILSYFMVGRGQSQNIRSHEYRVETVSTKPEEVERLLNLRASEGWELKTTTYYETHTHIAFYLILSRPTSGAPAASPARKQ